MVFVLRGAGGMAGKAKLSVEDQLEIQNLYAIYNLASDACDIEGYADCFTPEGEMLSPEVGIEVRGRESLKAHKTRDRDNRGGRYRRHWNGNLHLELQADGQVRGRCYLIAYNGSPGDLPAIADCGVYEDTLVRTKAGWRFARRTLTMDGSTWNQKPAEPAGEPR
jgi:hypothetical protein